MLALFTGLEIEVATPALAKKTPAAPQLGDKYNIKPAVLKRPRYKVLLSLSLTARLACPLVAFARINQTREPFLCCPLVASLMIFVSCVSHSNGPLDPPPVEKKYKPLNTPSNSAKEIKVKIIPAQRRSHASTRTPLCLHRLMEVVAD